MQTQISAGTIDAPSWDAVRVSKLAARMYAPLGTQMALSDFVRVWRIFADAFSGNKGMRRWKESQGPAEWSSSVSTRGDSEEGAWEYETGDDEAMDEEEFLREREELAKDLSVGFHLLPAHYGPPFLMMLSKQCRSIKTSWFTSVSKTNASAARSPAHSWRTESLSARPGSPSWF